MKPEGREPTQRSHSRSIDPTSPQLPDRFQHLLRLQYLLTVGPAIVFTSKPSGNYAATYVSDNITAITGYAPADFLNDPDFWVNHVHPDDLLRISAGLEKLATQDLLRHEYRFLHQDGQYRWMMNELRLIRDDTGEPIEIVGFLSDVSDRKQAEADLEASEQRLREIILKTIDGILILDQQGNILFSNPAAEQLFNCRLSELKNFSFGIPSTLQQPFELAVPNLKGELTILETRVEEIDWQGEKAFLAALRDISALKQFATAIVEDQTELIVRYLPDTTVIYANEAYCRFFGMERYDIINSSYEPVVYEADRERVAQFVQSLDANNPTGIIESRVINAAGEVRWTQWVNRMLFDDDGELTEIQAVGRDITDLKQTEEELRQSEERWQFALEGSGDGVWDWDLSTNTLFYSPRWKEMLGYDDSEVGNSLSEWSDRIHPDERDQILAATDQLLQGEIQQYTQEYRFRHKDGFYLWVLDRGRVVSRTPTGEPLRVIGTHSDITAMKQAEAEMRRSQISRSLVGDMLRDLQIRGNLSETAMFQAGQELAGRVHDETLEQFLDAFASMGLGTLALAETKPNRWTFTGDKLVSVDIGQRDQPTCHYPRGYLCGAIAQITQTPGQIAAVEMECQSMGDSCCKFVVQVMH